MLLVAPKLAKSIGLEPALLLQFLAELRALSGHDQITLTTHHQTELLGFWAEGHLRQLLGSLEEQGFLKLATDNSFQITLLNLAQQQLPQQSPQRQSPQKRTPQQGLPHERLPQEQAPRHQEISPPPPAIEPTPVVRISGNEARRRNQSEDDLAYLKMGVKPVQRVRAQKTPMSQTWEPSEDFARLLEFHDIPITFALSELAKFRQYYCATDRKEFSWDVRFLNWVQRAWHDSQHYKGRYDKQTDRADQPADTAREKRAVVRDALRNIENTDW